MPEPTRRGEAAPFCPVYFAWGAEKQESAVQNDHRISRVLRAMVGSFTCADCLAAVARVSSQEVSAFVAGAPGRQMKIEVMIARCARCNQSARVFRAPGSHAPRTEESA